MTDSTPAIWSPPRTGKTRIEELMAVCGTDDYMELHSRSVSDPAWFWATVASELEFPFPVPFVDAMDTSGGVEWTRWFVGGRTNVALAALRHAEEDADETACIGLAEDGDPVMLSFAELAARVGGTQRVLARNRVGEGDRVGVFAPMCVDALIAYLAIVAQGAIVVPLFSGFAAPAIRARLADSEAGLLMAPRSTVRGGREIDMFSIAADAVTGIDVLELGEATSGKAPFEPKLVECESPFLLGYTSGTTAKPKGALLSHGGAGLKIASEGAFNFDMRPGDRHLWVTDIGWIMGTWSILAALCNGAAVVLMEGLPVEPSDRLGKACDEHEITHLGVSPTLARGLMDKPDEIPPLPRLRAIGSTGEPLDEKAWNWLFHNVGRGRIPILNISGGTEVGAALLGPTPITPMKACTVGMPALGLDIQVIDETGSALGPGEVGELICRNAWPGMTRGLWRDPDRYIDAYWSQHPQVWTHGDWASFDEDGLWFLHGRSDDTINIAGKRIGPAEIEAVVLADSEVESAAVIGMPHQVKGEAIWVFAVGDGDREIETRLRTTVADALGASFRPERVVMVSDIPRTRSQKLARRVIRSVALGEEIGDTSGLDNPEAADAIRTTLERTG